MAANTSNIPTNAVEMLFVEDMIQWLLRRQAGISYTSKTVGSYRDFVFNVFNDDVRKAVNFLDMSLEDEIENDFSDFEELNEKSLMEYAFHCEEMYFKNGFLADDFLKYCVRLVSMAINFALFNVPEALNVTFHNILKLLVDRGLFTGGWDNIIMVARNYAKIYEDFHNVVTPDNSEAELPAYSSEDEVPTDSSENVPWVDNSEGKFLAESSEDVSRANLTENVSPAGSSADNLDINKGILTCNYVSNTDLLQNTKTDKDNL